MFRSNQVWRRLWSGNSSSHQNSDIPPILAAAAVGASCVMLQWYDQPFVTTQAEANNDNTNDNKKKDGDDEAPQPWYRRYTQYERKTAKRKKKQKESILDNDTLTSSNAMFEDQCLQRQMWTPRVPYPAWDYNWDGKMTPATSQEACATAEGLHHSCDAGTTRHLLLIRHGQYEEESDDDQYRVLTPLGEKQAQLTGHKLAQFIQQIQQRDGATIKAVHMSDMMRAKQTAALIAQHLPKDISIQDPDPLLNEALPAPMIPMRPDIHGATEEIDANQLRMNQAFHKYFYRADSPYQQQQQAQQDDSSYQPTISVSGSFLSSIVTSTPPEPQHEFELIVGHGNVIRYFVCRALQLPPEAWLRLSVFNCSITYIMIKPNGYVSIRMIGDIGHLGYDETTFSGLHGFVWS